MNQSSGVKSQESTEMLEKDKSKKSKAIRKSKSVSGNKSKEVLKGNSNDDISIKSKRPQVSHVSKDRPSWVTITKDEAKSARGESRARKNVSNDEKTDEIVKTPSSTKKKSRDQESKSGASSRKHSPRDTSSQDDDSSNYSYSSEIVDSDEDNNFLEQFNVLGLNPSHDELDSMKNLLMSTKKPDGQSASSISASGVESSSYSEDELNDLRTQLQGLENF